MDVQFTPEQEAQLSQIAMHNGTRAEQMVKDAALRILENDANFRSAVQKGIAAANRGDFLDEEEMDARVDQMLHS